MQMPEVVEPNVGHAGPLDGPGEAPLPNVVVVQSQPLLGAEDEVAQSLGGGLMIGYGAGLSMGCTVGAFFSAIPSLGLNGWIFGLALAGGAYMGTRLLRYLP